MTYVMGSVGMARGSFAVAAEDVVEVGRDVERLQREGHAISFAITHDDKFRVLGGMVDHYLTCKKCGGG